MPDPSKPWKIDVDILRSSQYENVSVGLPYLDEQDRLWLPVNISFDASQTTDAGWLVASSVLLVSEDKGLTWEITDRPWPGPSHNRVTMPDGTIVEVSASGYSRYPRTEVKRLEKEGYHAWDLGPKDDYCAIIYDLWQKRSTDNGKTWEKRDIHTQLPFFAHFVARGPLRLLDDGSLIFLAYGCTPEERITANEDHTATVKGRFHSYGHGRWSVYCVRSDDDGETWEAVRAADGRLSPSVHGFNETFPIVTGDGNIFVILRTQLGEFAYSVKSSDGGRTWSEPVQTPIRAKHPWPTALADGTMVCTYQRRFAVPYGVRARFASDNGKVWSEEVVLRDDIPLSDGVCTVNTVEFRDGTLFSVFQARKYDDKGRGWPFVGGCRWTKSYRRPYGPKLEVPAAGEKYNYPKGD